jgi:hypothetical protein
MSCAEAASASDKNKNRCRRNFIFTFAGMKNELKGNNFLMPTVNFEGLSE